jgi:hypothetical protein
MHAALISLVLMCGACGDVPREVETPDPPAGVVLASPACSISVSYPAPGGVLGCPGCGCGCNNSAVPPAYRYCPEHAPAGDKTQPAWTTNYHPAWYLYPNHRMFLDAVDYTQPYPYRERFNYPGYDPRCQCAVPPIGF